VLENVAADAVAQLLSVRTIVGDEVAVVIAKGLALLLGLRSIPGIVVWLANGYCEMIRGVARKDGEVGGIEEERYKLSPQMNSALREELVMYVNNASERVSVGWARVHPQQRHSNNYNQ
jgi:hypothetical protein